VDYKQFIHYAAKFYSNMGNYSSYGNSKFIPELDCEKFEEILKCSSSYSEIKYIWDCIKDIVYDDSLNFKTINLNEKNGKNSYYLGDIREEDIKTIDKFLQNKGIDLLNTRLMKISPSKFCYLVASVDERVEEWENSSIIGYYGEFSSFLTRVNENLRKAKEFCANEIQANMIDCYIESFKTGSIKKHIESQRWWVKDKKPVVETNVGWVETYIDPMGVRAYFEGFVALTDKEKTRKFNTLVENSEKFIASLPWTKDFEKTTFISPDFTALDVVCFASNGCPIGINIPNYAEVQETDGFKNISLSNAYPRFAADNLFFCNEKDIELLSQIGQQSYVMHVACHELLGHGTGKLFRRNEKGEFNFDVENLVNPLTNERIEKWYEENETYESKFTDVARSLEELRADLCGLYFTFFREVHEIFEFNETLYKDTIYSLWLLYIRKGILGLNLYNDEVKRWGQAHTQGAWIFVQFLLENQMSGQEILTINLEEDKKTFSINLNKYLLLF
jgi:dipeptidyl-peptidase-3